MTRITTTKFVFDFTSNVIFVALVSMTKRTAKA